MYTCHSGFKTILIIIHSEIHILHEHTLCIFKTETKAHEAIVKPSK